MHKTQKRKTVKIWHTEIWVIRIFQKKVSPVDHRWPPVELRFETYERLPPVTTGDPPVVTGGFPVRVVSFATVFFLRKLS